jgi:hypothetical protein
MNLFDKIVDVHPAAANDDVTLIYNFTDVKRILLEMVTDPRVDEIFKSLPE